MVMVMMIVTDGGCDFPFCCGVRLFHDGENNDLFAVGVAAPGLLLGARVPEEEGVLGLAI